MTYRKSKEQHRYELQKSPLYRLSNKKKLAELLGVEPSVLANLEKFGLCQQYNCFVDHKSRRFITEPINDLEKIHRRLLKLLVRIAPPEYIHSAVKKRSYKTNALAHINGGRVLKVDIKKFFQSVKFDCIHAFYLKKLECAPDIATILAKLCVVKTEKYGVHLPTGSCISPVLSFLANQTLFDQIKHICDQYDCVFTLYVDDITISGGMASKELLSKVVTQIFNRGYRYHKTNVSVSNHALITGLIVSNRRLYLPYNRVKKIHDLLKVMDVTVGQKEKLLASLVGRLSEAEQIEPKYTKIRRKVMAKHKEDWAKIVEKRTRKSRVSRIQSKVKPG